MAPIPIVICGRSSVVAGRVVADMRPDFETIHVCQTPDAAIKEIPSVLSGSKPRTTDSSLGSQNYEKRPVCVVVGGGFDPVMYADIKKACGDQKTVWLRPDMSKMSEMPPISEGERFGAATAVRVSKCLKHHRIGDGGAEEGEFLF